MSGNPTAATPPAATKPTTRPPSRTGRHRTAAAIIAIVTLILAARTAATRAASSASDVVCATRVLDVWLNTQAGRTAGSTYYTLELTNLSRRPCALRGYPRVSAVDRNGHQLGHAGARNAAHTTRTVTLTSGATAMAILQLTDTHNFPPAKCKTVTAAGLRVYPPSQRIARLITFPFPACARGDAVFLHVESIQPR